MSRHGLPFAFALLAFASGCQNPWRNTSEYTQAVSGLEQPNSLIEFPGSIAKYPRSASEDAQPADNRANALAPKIAQVSNEVPSVSASERELERLLTTAGDMLATATATPAGPDQDRLLADATSQYRRILQQDPGNGVAHHRLGVIGDLRKDFLAAEDHYRQALAQLPHDPDLLSDIGYSYQLQDRPEVARKFLERAIHISPSHSRASNNLGKLAAERGEYDEAYALFLQADSREHADRAIQYFFPDGKPASQPASPRETASTIAVTETETEKANVTLVSAAPQPPAQVETIPSVAEQSKAARERVRIVEAELMEGLNKQKNTTTRLLAEAVQKEAEKAFNVHGPLVDNPVIRPQPSRPATLKKPVIRSGSLTTRAPNPVRSQPETQQFQQQVQQPQPVQQQQQFQVQQAQSQQFASLPSSQSPSPSRVPARAPWKKLKVAAAPTYSLQNTQPVDPRSIATRPPIQLPEVRYQANIATDDGLWDAQPVDPASIKPLNRPNWASPSPALSPSQSVAVQPPAAPAVSTIPTQYPFDGIIQQPIEPDSGARTVSHETTLEPPPLPTGTIHAWPGLEDVPTQSTPGHSVPQVTTPPQYEPLPPRPQQEIPRAVYPETRSALPQINPGKAK